MSDWQQEKWLYRVPIDSTNKSILINEDAGGLVTITIDEGDYWVHDDPSLESTHPSLITEIEAKLNASGSLSGTYTCSASTPTESPTIGAFGIKITVSGASSFTLLDASSSTATRPALAECLGLPFVTEARTISSVGTVLYSPYTYAGCWAAPRWRSEATPDLEPLVFAASEYEEQGDSYVMDYGTRHKRTWRYVHVPAAHVFTSRGALAAYAATAELGLGDGNNALEYLYLAASRRTDLLVVEYPVGTDADLSVDDTHPYEVLRLASTRAFSDMQRRTRDGGEYHDLQWETYRVSGDLLY